MTFKAKIGGGSTKAELDNNVVVYLIDNSGNEISGTRTIVTTKVESQGTNSTEYTVTIPNVSSAYGVEMIHAKESGFNVRYFGIYFKAE